MNRPRRLNPEGLPPCVYRKHGAYWLVKKGKWTRLGEDRQSALTAYGRLTNPIDVKGSFPAFCDATHDLYKHKWAPNTIATYDQARKALNRVFSDFHPEQIKRKHVKAMVDAQAKKPRLANRNLGFLRIVMNRALDLEMIEADPCVSIHKLPVKARDRALSDSEYIAIRACAGDRLQVIMDLCYFTGQRIGDILAVKHEDLTDEGIRFRQQKTKARLTVAWSPALRIAVERAKTLTSAGKVAAMPSGYLLRGEVAHKRHLPPRYTVVLAQWVAACALAKVENANLHDLRAKAASDAKRQGFDPQALLGHTDARTTRDYLRGMESPLVQGPGIRQSNRQGG
jgi:integrase